MRISCLTKPTQNKQIRENYRGCIIDSNTKGDRFVIREDWDIFKNLNFKDRINPENSFKIINKLEIALVSEPNSEELKPFLKKYDSNEISFKGQDFLILHNNFNFDTTNIALNLRAKGQDNKEQIIAMQSPTNTSKLVLQYLPEESLSYHYSQDFIIYNLKGACTAGSAYYIDNGAKHFSGINVQIKSLDNYSINVLEFRKINKLEDIWIY